MAAAVSKMKASSENTAKIVKTINDIAYETSLLSLNASVETARAGEAGMGVTGEMRKLAKRSAEAVKNSAAIMGDSVTNAAIGVKLTEETAASLAKIVARTEKASGLIAKIADASSEQAHGLELVNGFLAHMNRVNHNIAADSDESAAASAELNRQAAELSELVEGFKLSGDAGRYYADRNAAEVWVELAPEAEVSVSPAYAEAAAVEICEEPAVSVSPAAVSAHKRRQRRRKRMASYRADKTYKHKRRIRATARRIARTSRNKHHPLLTRFLRAARAKEIFQHTGSALGAGADAVAV